MLRIMQSVRTTWVRSLQNTDAGHRSYSLINTRKRITTDVCNYDSTAKGYIKSGHHATRIQKCIDAALLD